MKLIGLTGTSGSGKGYVAALFARRGIGSIDTDALVHRLYREDSHCIAELERTFGALCGADGAIDRRRLAAIVFTDREKLSMLNSIVHRYVKREVERICCRKEAQGCSILLMDAPQLFEAGMETMCHKVVAVVAPESIRLERICARDSIDHAAALQRFHHQHSDTFFEAHADYLIRNDGTLPLQEQVDRIIGELQND